MAHHTEQVGFPAILLQPGMKLRLRALSPTTDTAITGVTAAQWSIYGRDEGEGVEQPLEAVEPFYVPTSG